MGTLTVPQNFKQHFSPHQIDPITTITMPTIMITIVITALVLVLVLVLVLESPSTRMNLVSKTLLYAFVWMHLCVY